MREKNAGAARQSCGVPPDGRRSRGANRRRGGEADETTARPFDRGRPSEAAAGERTAAGQAGRDGEEPTCAGAASEDGAVGHDGCRAAADDVTAGAGAPSSGGPAGHQGLRGPAADDSWDRLPRHPGRRERPLAGRDRKAHSRRATVRRAGPRAHALNRAASAVGSATEGAGGAPVIHVAADHAWVHRMHDSYPLRPAERCQWTPTGVSLSEIHRRVRQYRRRPARSSPVPGKDGGVAPYGAAARAPSADGPARAGVDRCRSRRAAVAAPRTASFVVPVVRVSGAGGRARGSHALPRARATTGRSPFRSAAHRSAARPYR